MASDNWDTIGYIDGVRHRAKNLGSPMFVDSDDLPRRRCSQHNLTPANVLWLKGGGAVLTSGHRYCLHPDKEPTP